MCPLHAAYFFTDAIRNHAAYHTAYFDITRYFYALFLCIISFNLRIASSQSSRLPKAVRRM